MKRMLNITVFAKDLAFHERFHATTETVNGNGFIILLLGFKMQRSLKREDGSVMILKPCKFFILKNTYITLVNPNKEFELNLLVGMGCMELSFSLSCWQLFCR